MSLPIWVCRKLFWFDEIEMSDHQIPFQHQASRWCWPCPLCRLIHWRRALTGSTRRAAPSTRPPWWWSSRAWAWMLTRSAGCYLLYTRPASNVWRCSEDSFNCIVRKIANHRLKICFTDGHGQLRRGRGRGGRGEIQLHNVLSGEEWWVAVWIRSICIAKNNLLL